MTARLTLPPVVKIKVVGIAHKLVTSIMVVIGQEALKYYLVIRRVLPTEPCEALGQTGILRAPRVIKLLSGLEFPCKRTKVVSSKAVKTKNPLSF